MSGGVEEKAVLTTRSHKIVYLAARCCCPAMNIRRNAPDEARSMTVNIGAEDWGCVTGIGDQSVSPVPARRG